VSGEAPSTSGTGVGTTTATTDDTENSVPPLPDEESTAPSEQNPEEAEQAPLPQGNVPPDLVGAWNGGPGNSSEFWLIINPDGAYEWTGGDVFSSSGVAQVDGQALYLIEPDGRGYALQWEIDQFGFLHIADDSGVDSSYVRG
jgi:hypothetical protein